MKRKMVIVIASVAILYLCTSFIAAKGWKPSGSAPDKYDIGLWKIGGHDSKQCGMIRSSKSDYFSDDYASLIQAISSQKYLGKRIKMTAYMKTRAVTDHAGFFLRADHEDLNKPITFDNMRDRPIKGTTDWTAYSIELDIPVSASKIAFGGYLHGKGQIWFDDISFEVVGDATITATLVQCDTSIKRNPENLDFEQ